jgi:hypothetical protein
MTNGEKYFCTRKAIKTIPTGYLNQVLRIKCFDIPERTEGSNFLARTITYCGPTVPGNKTDFLHKTLQVRLFFTIRLSIVAR